MCVVFGYRRMRPYARTAGRRHMASETAERDPERSSDGQSSDGRVSGDREAKAAEPAEISNYEIVTHYFDGAAERLGLHDDVAAVFRCPYREVQVQIPEIGRASCRERV